MSENNTRPIYIKKQHRKRNRPSSDQQRLHGAFTGGFSAGHFNTVGSKDGWKPSYAYDDIENEEEIGGSNNPFVSSSCFKSKNKSKRKNYEQKLEDYMDEEDANEWGGPIKVKATYQTKSNNDNIENNDERHAHKSLITDSSSLRNLLHQKKNKNDSTSIGKQLLKVLGWRENRSTYNDNNHSISSYAYVPIDDDEKPQRESLLSSKKLKRIEIQLSSQHNSNYIPPPKIDTYGMGFEPYKNAPEFKAHRELRKRRAEDRARAASNSKGENRMNVYNMSALNDFGDDDDDDGGGSSNNGPRTQKIGHEQHNKGSGSNVLAYETMEDFIGNTTSAGFALHDDDDQVYDKNAGHSASLFNKGERGKIDMSEYHNEVYEGSDSEVEDSTFHEHDDGIVKNKKQNSVKLNQTQHSTLQSFAGALSNWASDGNAKASSQSEQRSKAITSDGEAPLHGFELGGGNSETMKRYPGPDVPHDFVPKPHEFSNQDAISNMKALTSIMKDNMKSTNSDSVLNNRQKEGPMASKAFASLSTALKSRFTTSTLKQGINPKNEETLDPRRVKVTRSTVSWQPTHLLLKRFNVDRSTCFITQSNNPTHNNNSQQVTKTREEDFFEKDILSHVNAKKLNNDSSSLNQHVLSAETINAERPSLDLMKSIFEPSSDEDEDHTSELMQIDPEKKNQQQSESLCHSDEQYNNRNITSSLEVENHTDIASDSSSSIKRHKKRKKSSSNDRKRKKHKSKRKK